LGRCEFQWRDYIAASDLFRRALDLGVPPEMEDDIRLYLGICHVQLEEFDEALEALEGIRRITSSVLFFQAASLLGKGRLQEALRGFQEALDRGPDPEDLSSIHFYLGHCLKELEQWEEAVRHLEEALEADPRSYEAWNLLGYCRFRLGCHHEAIQAFLKALEIRPRSAVDLANIGRNLWELGDLEGARRWYQRALALDPTLVFAKEHLARIKRQKNGGPDS
jgi:ribosomal protein S12 methylthiotransferase accessory factor